MKPNLKITSLLINIPLPCKALEHYTNFRMRKEKYKTPATGLDCLLAARQLEAISACSCEPVVKGQLEISYHMQPCGCIEKIKLPVKAAFLTTLVKTQKTAYQFCWSVSLS